MIYMGIDLKITIILRQDNRDMTYIFKIAKKEMAKSTQKRSRPTTTIGSAASRKGWSR